MRLNFYAGEATDPEASVEVDYAYQAEQWVQDTTRDAPHFTRWVLTEDGASTVLARWLRRPTGRVAMVERSPHFDGEWAVGVEFS
jgi:hypothetical protein